MKGLFIFYREIDAENLNGIDKKVISQIDTFRENNIDCKLFIMKRNKIEETPKIYNTIMSRLPFGNISPYWEYSKEFDSMDFIYLRRPDYISKAMLRVFRKIKKRNPNIKIILEIPTYPYDDELKARKIDYPYYIKDKINRGKLNEVVDRIAVQNDLSEIFDIPTLIFSNGIRVDNIKPREVIPLKGINICAVASLEPWQGYERIIIGLSNYYKNNGKENIQINIVGEGKEKSYYKQLVKEHKLENNIKLLGFLSGKELEDVYSNSDIALDSFGRYKTNNQFSTSLKSREYLAKGLPIVSGSKVDILDTKFPYYYEFPSNDSPVDFEIIVDFHKKVYTSDKREIISNLRRYAYETCDMSKTMGSIINYIKS